MVDHLWKGDFLQVGLLIPAFDFQQVVVEPWTDYFSSFIWIFLMGFFLTSACGLIGVFLILRRLALMGDAISHTVLPGLVVAFLLTGSLGVGEMVVGAFFAGVITTFLVELIHTKSRVKQDAAIGITFSSLFALGVVLISLFANDVHLDADCVLYGEISMLVTEPPVIMGGIEWGPFPVLMMGGVFVMVVLVMILFYKELLVSSFDPGLAASQGINSKWVHYLLMIGLSLVVISAFQAVGSILVIAMLILPGATALLISNRMGKVFVWCLVSAFFSSLFGMHLGLWLNCSIAAAMVVVASVWFVLAWLWRSGFKSA